MNNSMKCLGIIVLMILLVQNAYSTKSNDTAFHHSSVYITTDLSGLFVITWDKSTGSSISNINYTMDLLDVNKSFITNLIMQSPSNAILFDPSVYSDGYYFLNNTICYTKKNGKVKCDNKLYSKPFQISGGGVVISKPKGNWKKYQVGNDPTELTCDITGFTNIASVQLYMSDRYLQGFNPTNHINYPALGENNTTFRFTMDSGDYNYGCLVTDTSGFTYWTHNNSINIQFNSWGSGNKKESTTDTWGGGGFIPEEKVQLPLDEPIVQGFGLLGLAGFAARKLLFRH